MDKLVRRLWRHIRLRYMPRFRGGSSSRVQYTSLRVRRVMFNSRLLELIYVWVLFARLFLGKIVLAKVEFHHHLIWIIIYPTQLLQWIQGYHDINLASSNGWAHLWLWLSVFTLSHKDATYTMTCEIFGLWNVPYQIDTFSENMWIYRYMILGRLYILSESLFLNN